MGFNSAFKELYKIFFDGILDILNVLDVCIYLKMYFDSLLIKSTGMYVGQHVFSHIPLFLCLRTEDSLRFAERTSQILIANGNHSNTTVSVCVD